MTYIFHQIPIVFGLFIAQNSKIEITLVLEQPLMDITHKQTNNMYFDSLESQENILSDEKCHNKKLEYTKGSQFEKFTLPSQSGEKCTSRSLANRQRKQKKKCKKDLNYLKNKLIEQSDSNLMRTFKINRSHNNPEGANRNAMLNTFDPRFQEDSILKSDIVNINRYQNSEYNCQYSNSKNSQNKTDLSYLEENSEMSQLHQKLNSTEVDSLRWKKYSEGQHNKIADLEFELLSVKKELRKAHKKIVKYKQLKEHSDVALHKQTENQKESMSIQSAKMKELFLKEYEELIIEKNNEIKSLNQQAVKANSDVKDYKYEINGKSLPH